MEKLEELENRIYAVELQMQNIPKRTEIEEIVKQGLIQALKEVGMTTKTVLLTTAGIFGAIGIIVGSLRAIWSIFR